MKIRGRLLLLTISSCLIGGALFSQDSSKIYTVKFSGYDTTLSKEAKATLADLAKTMRAQPAWRYTIESCTVTRNERFNVAIWNRVNNVVIYLVEKEGINADRIIFTYSDRLDSCNNLNFTFTTMPPPSSEAPPHPNLRKKIKN